MYRILRLALRHAPSLAVAALCALLPGAIAPEPAAAADDAPAPKPVTLGVEQIDETLYRISGSASGGVLVLVGREGLLLVDSEDAANAAVFDSVLHTISGLPVKTIVNTHYHYDHIGGNARFREAGAEIIAHENMWAQAVKDTVIADWGDWHRKAAPAGAKPTRTFADTLRFDFEGDPLVLMHVPAAHSDNDVAVWLPEHDVLHVGDVVEIDAPPFVDLWAGGTVGGMIRALDRFIRFARDSTRVVPGHGRIISAEELRAYRAMIGAIATRAYESIREGRDLERFVALEPAGEFEDHFGGPRGARQVAALFFYALNGMKKEAASP